MVLICAPMISAEPDCDRLQAKHLRNPGLTQRQIRRGSNHSVRALEDAKRVYLKANNEHPKPFTWVKTPDEILARPPRSGLATSEAGH